MNIKLHTPKSLKKGSGMGTPKQFLLSILATTVSIALTFGTAAVIDHNKKQREKHEIVMMVMYDMYNTLQSVEKADSMFHRSINLQLQIAEDTSKFDKLKYLMMNQVPLIEYTETAERIFSTNIETINTVGNVLFIENVADFYNSRKLYKEEICDSLFKIISNDKPFNSISGLLDFDYSSNAIFSHFIIKNMKQCFAECKQMMNVTDEEIESYRQKRDDLRKQVSGENTLSDSIQNEMLQIQEKLENAKKKLKL